MPTVPPAAPPDERTPWPGLDAFTQREKERFCGRQADLDDLLQRVKRDVGTVLYGQSGLGKTSLLQAGLSPALEREHHLPVLIRLIHKGDAPPLVEQVRLEIVRAMEAAALFDPVYPAPGEDLWRYLHRRDVPFLTQEGYDARLVLIFDQFEEIFTNGQATPVQARRSKEFFGQLAELVQGRTPASVRAELEAAPEAARNLKLREHDFHVLVTLREDYLPHLDTAVERFMAPDLVRNRQRLLPFDGHGALAAVEGPGAGLLEPGVAERIARKVAAARQRSLSVAFLGEADDAPLGMEDLRIEPALLSLLCARLNALRLERQRQSGRPELITAALVEGMGERVLESFYQETLHELSPRQRAPVAAFIEEKLLSEGGQHRQQVVMDSAEKMLADGGVPAGEARPTIDRLIQRRLLRIEDRGDIPRLELTHDVLCPVVGHFRDARRARRERLQWWKNAASIAAVGFFLAAIYFAFDASRKSRVAIVKGNEAMASRDRAEIATAAAARAETEARAAEGNARIEAGSFYGQLARQQAAARDLGAATVLWARGTEVGAMRRPEVFGYVAATPLVSGPRRFKLDAPAGRLAWGTARRQLLGITTGKIPRLFVLDGESPAPRWLQRRADAGLFLAPLVDPAAAKPPAEDRRPAVLAAIPWRGADGGEAILASVKDEGLTVIRPDGTCSVPRRLLGCDPTALLQDPVSGATWAGLESGIVFRLDAAAAAPDPAFEPYVAPEVSPVRPDGDAPVESPDGLWRYEAVNPDGDQETTPEQPSDRRTAERRRLRAGATEDGSPLWRIVNTRTKQPAPLPPELTRAKLATVLFSPGGREVLLRTTDAPQTWLFTLPANSESTRAGPAGNPLGASGPTERDGVKTVPTALVGTPLKPGHEVNCEVFVKGAGLVALGGPDGALSLFQTAGEKRAFRCPLEKGSGGVSRMIATEDGGQLTVIQGDESNPARRLTVVRLRNDGASALAAVPGKAFNFSREPTLTFTRDGGQALVQHPAVNARVKPRREWLKVSEETLRPEVPWERLAPGLSGGRVGGLALDAQGQVVAASCASGVGFLEGKTGLPLEDFLRWPNPRPETLISLAGRNQFFAASDPGHFWTLGFEPYRSSQPPDLSYTTASRRGDFPTGMLVQTEHPSGHLTAGGFRDGSLRLYRDVTSSPESESWLEGSAPFQKGVATLAFSPDGKTLAAADEAGTLAVWDVADDPQPQLALASRGKEAPAGPEIVQLPDGAFVGLDRAGLFRWDAGRAALVPLPLEPSPRRVLALGAGLTGGRPPCALAEETESRLVWVDLTTRRTFAAADLTASRIIRPHPGVTEKMTRLTRAFLSPGGRRCAVLNQLGEVEFWTAPEGNGSVANARVSSPAPPSESDPSAAPADPAERVAFDASGRWAVVISRKEQQATVVDLDQEPPRARKLADRHVFDAAPIPGTTVFLLATTEGAFRLDPSLEGALSADQMLSDRPVRQVAVSPDGSLALASGEDAPPTLFDLKERSPLGPLAHALAADFSRGAVFAADSRRLFGVSHDQLRWWEPSPGLSLAQARRVTGLTINADREAVPTDPTAEERTAAAGLPRPFPLAARAWPAAHRVALGLKAALGKDSDPGSRSAGEIAAVTGEPDFARLSPSLQARAQDLAAMGAPTGPTFAARHVCLLEAASERLAFHLVTPGNPPPSWAAWTGEMRGAWGWLGVMDRLAAATAEGKGERMVNDGRDLSPGWRETVTSAHREVLAATAGGYTPDPTWMHHLDRTLLDDFDSAVRLWRSGPDASSEESLRRILEFKRWIADFRPGDATAWNNLGVARDNLRGKVPKLTDPPAAGAPRSEWLTLLAEAIEAYQRCVLESDPAAGSTDLTYGLANWSSQLNEIPEDPANPAQTEEYRQAAARLAREATVVGPEVAYAWQRLRERALTSEEKLRAARQYVLLLEKAPEDTPEGKTKLRDARNQLGASCREMGLIDKAADVFEKLVATTPANEPANVFALVELGELLRLGGYPLKECLAPFLEATRHDEKRKPEEQDQWGQWRLGVACEQWEQRENAVAAYGRSLRISEARKEKRPNALLSLTVAELRLNRWEDAGGHAADLEGRAMWDGLLSAGRAGWLLARNEGQKTLAARWMNTALERAATDKFLLERARALAILGRGEEAARTLARHVAKTPPPERTDTFWQGIHLCQADLRAGRAAPAEAVWELARASVRGWQNVEDLVLNENLERALGEVPEYAAFRSALRVPYDAPERFLALARFQFDAADALRRSGGTADDAAVGASHEAAARFLADAVRRGWNPTDEELRQRPFDVVAALPGWPEQLAAARQEVVRELRAEGIIMAKAFATARKEKNWRPADSDAGRCQQIAPRLVGHAGLKRRQGLDFYGHPYGFDLKTGRLSVSPLTRRLVGSWLVVNPEFWTVEADAEE